jgi:hypothetical protein
MCRHWSWIKGSVAHIICTYATNLCCMPTHCTHAEQQVNIPSTLAQVVTLLTTFGTCPLGISAGTPTELRFLAVFHIKLAHDTFLPNPFQLILHCCSRIRCYKHIVWVIDVTVKGSSKYGREERHKLKLYKAMKFSTLMYGSQTWVLTKRSLQCIE